MTLGETSDSFDKTSNIPHGYTYLDLITVDNEISHLGPAATSKTQITKLLSSSMLLVIERTEVEYSLTALYIPWCPKEEV